jgi:hypothetical protein
MAGLFKMFNYLCFEFKTSMITANMDFHVCSLAENSFGPVDFHQLGQKCLREVPVSGALSLSASPGLSNNQEFKRVPACLITKSN